MLPGVWLKMVSCSLRSPHLSGDSSVCLSVVKRSPCLFSPEWHVFLFAEQQPGWSYPYETRIQGPYAFLHLYQWLPNWRTLRAGPLMNQTLRIMACSAPHPYLPSWSEVTVGCCWPKRAWLWVLVWLVAGRWASVVKIRKEKQTENNESCKMQFCHDVLARGASALRWPDPTHISGSVPHWHFLT